MISNPEKESIDPVESVLAMPASLSALDRKILENFPGLVVRKDITKGLKQNAVVPTYVLEYLLGQHCATDDPQVLKTGWNLSNGYWRSTMCIETRLNSSNPQ